jgi:hypothetical protein
LPETNSDDAKSNLFEHQHDITQHSFGSKSAKGTLTSTSSTNGDSVALDQVSHPTPMPSPATFTTTATLINQQEIVVESTQPISSPGYSSTSPTNNQSSTNLSNAVIIPALSTNPLKTKADKTQDNNDFLNEMDYSGNDDQEQITITRNHSTIMVDEKNNVFLAYGLVSASAVLTLATVGLIASRRKSVIAEKRASMLTSMEELSA